MSNSKINRTPDLPHGADISRNQTILLLIAIVVFGTILRLHTLGTQPYWLDEVLTLYLAQIPITEWFSGFIDMSPPLYYWIHKVVLGAETDPYMVRSISLVFGVLTLPIVFMIGKETHSTFVGLVASSFVAVSDVFIEYSQEARTYAMLNFFVAVAILNFIRAFRQTQSRAFLKPLIIANFACVLAAYCHFSILLWIGLIQTAALIVVCRDPSGRTERLRPFVAISALALIAILPVTFFLWQALEEGGATWIAGPDLFRLRRTYHQLLMVRGFAMNPTWAAVPIYVLALYGLVRAWSLDRGASFVLLSLGLFPLVLFVASYASPMLLTRSALPAGLAFAIVIAIVLCDLPPRLRIGSVMVLLATFTASSVFHARDPSTHMDHTWKLAEIVRENAQDGDVVVFAPSFLWRSFTYHLGPDFTQPIYYWDGTKTRTAPHTVDGIVPWLSRYDVEGAPPTDAVKLQQATDRIWSVGGFWDFSAIDDFVVPPDFTSETLFDLDGERLVLHQRSRQSATEVQN